MRVLIVIFATLLAAADTHASEVCGLVVARHLAAQNSDAVVKLFAAEGPDTRQAVAYLVAKVGALSSLSEAPAPRFKEYARLSVLSHDLQASYRSLVQRIDAASSTLGPVQLVVAIAPGSQCSVLAVHVDAMRK